MLAKVFKIDVTKCVSCGGNLVKVAAITNLMEARRYLRHEGSKVKLKELRLLRSEGKDYVVQDGDVMEFHFIV